jgi:Response regulator containing CheY-like receiver domain and AraC-type DNA-binding domain
MHTLLIVDDEPLSQVGLKSMLDWQSLGVSIVGTSPNGLHAFDEIGRLRPDIVIADVRMPLLDGLSLIERCRAAPGGGPEFIVLSGYADFESARRAMRGQAIDYLVKLELDEACLRASVEKAMAAVDEKRRLGLAAAEPRLAAPAGQRGAPRGDPFAETALARLLSGSFAGEEEARSCLERSGVDAGSGARCVVRFSVRYANSDRLTEAERLRAYFCAIDMVRQLLGRESVAQAVPFDPSSFAALLAFPEGAEDIDSRALAAVERASDMTQKYFGVELAAGVGGPRRELLGVADSYREAARALSATTEARPVLSFEEAKSLRPSASEQDQASRRLSSRREALVEALVSRSPEALRAVLDEALAELDFGGLSASDAIAATCELAYPMIERLEQGEALLDSFFPGEGSGWRSLFSAGSAAQARAWVERVEEGLCPRFESLRSKGRNPLVAGVQRYVRENYSGRLSLGEVAARFEVSPNHLSTVFKKYAGQGYAEFVAQVKMDKAKELILGGHYKMFEVAQLLGFEDAFYFSKVFKKVEGLSPREFYLRACERSPKDDS